jgi:hypothetical protein
MTAHAAALCSLSLSPLLAALHDGAAPGRIWRTHELCARVPEPVDQEAVAAALREAIVAYPAEDDLRPAIHSSFQPPRGRLARVTWTVEGRAAAEALVL